MPDAWYYSENPDDPPAQQAGRQLQAHVSQQYDPAGHAARLAPRIPRPSFQPPATPSYAATQRPALPGTRRYSPQAAYAPQQKYQPPRDGRKRSLTPAEQFWYVLMNIGFAAGYFIKVPAKKALSDYGMAEMTAAEKFWYILMCIPFGAAYFAKIPVAKALEDMLRQS